MSTLARFFEAGVRIVHLLSEEHWTSLATPVPTLKVVRPGAVANPLPVTVIAVPPAIGPEDGETPVTVGASYLNRSLALGGLVPPGPVTCTSSDPELPGGER